MALIVQKFGGTSVGNLERIQRAAAKVIQTRAQGHDVVVVVSAMSGETDRLINLAKAIHDQPDSREYASLVATGEQVSIALFALALIAQGCPARSYTGTQAQIKTDNHHKKARILSIDDEILRNDLAAGYVPVVAGFQGISAEGDITTLGRGGSDTTAVALAAILQADECQIYTDVDGVYTADPKIVPEAQKLNEITFTEMLELASQGAKVIQQRAVEFAGKYQVPLRILSSFQDGVGTFINFAEEGMEKPIITGIAYSRFEAKLTVKGLPLRMEIIAEIIAALNSQQIDTDMLAQQMVTTNTMDFTLTTARDDYANAFNILNELVKKYNTQEIITNVKVAKLSLIGVGLRSHPAIMSTLFKILGIHGIPVQLITTAEIKISLLLNEADLERGVQVLHTAFGLENKNAAEMAGAF